MSGGMKKRPMPEGFAEDARIMGRKALQEKYSAGKLAVYRWRREIGLDPTSTEVADVPSDFNEVAPTMTRKRLQEHYCVGERRLRHWIATSGVEPPREATKSGPKGRPIPSDFMERAATMTRWQLRSHYEASWEVLERWCAETGVNPTSTRQPAVKRVVQNWRPANHQDMRKHTIFDEAADTIRRERFAVYRCDKRGRYSEKGELWRVGNTLLTPDELLQRADKYRRRAA